MPFDTMTDPNLPPRNRDRWTECAAILLILLLAAAIRIHSVAFGLPALNDPDEPLFMMTALDMLRSGNPNPGWFGHPATLTFYAIALVMVAVAGAGILTGRFADLDAFVAAAYADPSILFLPARLFFVACGVLCVWLTYRLGKRLGGARLGLIAAAFLAVNSVHVSYSQVIRTDVQMTVFVLLATLASLNIVERGRWRDYVLAGMFLGLGVATKWPAALFAMSPIVAAFVTGKGWGGVRNAAVVGTAALAALLIASPFLLLDYGTVIHNLTGEARPAHPGATGGGLLVNIGWYLRGPLLDSFGAAGLAAVAIGSALGLRDRRVRIAVLPGAAALAVVICAQALVWERWVVPLLPFLALAAAAAICGLANLLRAQFGRRLTGIEFAVIAALLMAPMVAATLTAQTERANDTRQAAAAWIVANAPPGSTILVEHAAFDLLEKGWSLRFPLGSAGCVDAAGLLAGRIPYSRVETLRAGSAVVDIGHLDPAQVAACSAQFAIFTHDEVYRTDPDRYRPQLDIYRAISEGGRLRAVIRPEPGNRGGPVVRIFELTRPPE
jgi:4-amino-4-deoxy-L-arabinose transferase-like glycosyltransferase